MVIRKISSAFVRINESLKRVAKKAHKEDQSAADNFVESTLDRIKVSTSAVECFDTGEDVNNTFF